jgi:hypothetical protein
MVMRMRMLTCDMRSAWGRWLSAQQTLLAAAWPTPDDADETLMLMLMLAAAGGRRRSEVCDGAGAAAKV